MKIQNAKNAVDWAKLYHEKNDTFWLHFAAKALEDFYEDETNWWESEDFLNLSPLEFSYGVEERVFHDLYKFLK